ncbi:MAG: dihydroorotate dehydrogenase [Methylobacteriaceae bacterium]|nr:dihydroorotate dehydrogenase [Methylobacteriaceae bacterium]
MIGSLFQLARPFLHALDPETAHHATLLALQFAVLPGAARDDPRLAVSAFGLDFSSPIGLAAGFDKDGVAPDNLLALGFGFVEVGTITPEPQSGNPRPRLFRLDRDEGVINRLGFNSAGHAKAHANLARRRGTGIIGVNLGANKDSSDRIGDYVAGIEVFADLASYFTINVSSPNTPGLRDLQQAPALDELLARALEARDRAAIRRPLLLKIAPDLSLGELDEIVRVARERKIEGMIVSNTTISRPKSLVSFHAKESGGLSGRPLFDASTQMLAETHRRVEGQFPLIGVGGIDGPEAALAKLEAGATLIQLYSSFVFDGPELIGKIKRGIVRRLEQEKSRSLHDVVGRRASSGIG